MASTRSTNTAEEILQRVLADLSQAKSAPDGMQWLPALVKIETTILQAIQEGRQQQAQQQLQQQQQPGGLSGIGGMGGAQPMAPGGGGGMPILPGMAPTGMGPPGMPGQPGPGIAGLRRSTPINPDELRRLMTNPGA